MRLVLVLLSLLPVSAQKLPVLVELFTSQGCSSCPPADTLLAKLEKEQPVPGVEVIVLSQHVDYWDQLGWRDPFSSAQFTRRQSIYAARLGAHGNYTPQMVVDGKVEFVGSDTRRALVAITEAAKRPKGAMRLTTVDRQPGAWTIRIDISDAPALIEVMVALVDPSATIQVPRGENGGRELRHSGVVRTLTGAGTVAKSDGFTKEVTLKPSSPNQRAVVFLQAKNQGAVLGAALLP